MTLECSCTVVEMLTSKRLPEWTAGPAWPDQAGVRSPAAPVSGAPDLLARAARGRASYDAHYARGEERESFVPRTVQPEARPYDPERRAVDFVPCRTVPREGVSDGAPVPTRLVARRLLRGPTLSVLEERPEVFTVTRCKRFDVVDPLRAALRVFPQARCESFGVVDPLGAALRVLPQAR